MRPVIARGVGLPCDVREGTRVEVVGDEMIVAVEERDSKQYSQTFDKAPYHMWMVRTVCNVSAILADSQENCRRALNRSLRLTKYRRPVGDDAFSLE